MAALQSTRLASFLERVASNENLDTTFSNYKRLPLEDRRLLHELHDKTGSVDAVKNLLEQVVFKAKPPTPEEFLDPANGWVPEGVIDDDDYPCARKDFLEILNNEKCYSQIVTYGGTRLGKSYLARLLMLYTVVFIHHLRDPKAFYRIAPTTALTLYLLAFNLDKARELLLDDFFKLLEASERFIKVGRRDQVKPAQKEVGIDYIVYSTAARAGEITLASDLRIRLGNDNPSSIIGANVLQMYVSELAFFIEEAGATEEQIFRLYTQGLDRIRGTVGTKYLAFAYLDTSANNAESLIEKHILTKLKDKEGVFFTWRSRWEARPHLYPIWQKTGKTFQVITGNGSIPAQMLDPNVDNTELLRDVPKNLIIDVPIDAYDAFAENILEHIKQQAGRPTSLENKFIQNRKVLQDLFNNSSLLNEEGVHEADSRDTPELLLWNILKDRYFLKYNGTDYMIRRANKEPRWLGFDLAKAVKGDLMGIAMVHKEWSLELKQVIYIGDFCFAVGPGESGINLDAASQFVTDLAKHGNIQIRNVYADKAYSSNLFQHLERSHVPYKYNSVDTSIDPYSQLLSALLTERIKVGRNIFLRNNLDSLQRTRAAGVKQMEKIDHTSGSRRNKYTGDFENSQSGIHAKDVSDALAQAFYAAFQDEYLPSTIYETENQRHQHLQLGSNSLAPVIAFQDTVSNMSTEQKTIIRQAFIAMQPTHIPQSAQSSWRRR